MAEHALAGHTLADRYDLLALLGTGGMGAVYRAHDRELDELVALKVIKPELSRDPVMVDRFRHEGEARAAGHPRERRAHVRARPRRRLHVLHDGARRRRVAAPPARPRRQARDTGWSDARCSRRRAAPPSTPARGPQVKRRAEAILDALYGDGKALSDTLVA